MTFQDRDQSSSRVSVGKIASAHGVKGLVKVLPFVEDLSLLEKVFIDERDEKTLSMKIKNPLGKYILVEIAGITDRNAAEALGKPTLFASRETITLTNPSIALIGLDVENESGEKIGRVRGIENYGASDLLDIVLDSGKSVLVPLTDGFAVADGTVVKITNYEEFLG